MRRCVFLERIWETGCFFPEKRSRDLCYSGKTEETHFLCFFLDVWKACFFFFKTIFFERVDVFLFFPLNF